MGSQKLFTPDYYRIGYMTVAGMRYTYDAPYFMRDYLRRTSSPFGMNALQKTMKDYSGKRIKGTWEDISSTFKDIWAQDDSLRGPFQEISPLVQAGKYFTAYSGGVQAGDGTVYSLRTSLDRTQELVVIRKNGVVSPVRPISADSKLAYSPLTDCLYWAETVPDLRWDMAQTSRIRMLRCGEDKIADFTREGRYVNPCVSGDGKLLAAAEYPVRGGSRIVVFDLPGGEKISSTNMPDGLQVTDLAFSGEGVVFTGISEDGMGLYSLRDGAVGILEPAAPIKIKNLVSHDGAVYFTADRTGTNEIYMWKDGAVTQLTNTWHGVSSPFFIDGELAFMALGPTGSLPSTADGVLSRKVSLQDYATYPVADVLSAQEKELPVVEAEVSHPAPTKYSKPGNFFRIHSWMPLYYNFDGFTASYSDYYYETASPGAMVMFQNLTGTASGTLGVSFHEDPFNEDALAAGIHARLHYSGLYPVFDLSLDAGDRSRASLSNAFVPATDSVFVAASPLEGIYVGAGATVSVPLDFSSGGRDRVLLPFVSASFSNDVIGEGYAFYKEDGATEIPAYNAGKATAGRWFMTNWSVSAGVTGYSKLGTAQSAVMPRLGFGGGFKVVASTFGSGMELGAYTYLPGFASTHGVKLSADARAKFVQKEYMFTLYGYGKGYMLPEDSWAKGYSDLAPRGLQNVGAGDVINLFCPTAARLSLDYAAPFFSWDRSFGPYLYLTNFELNPFADFTPLMRDKFEFLYSAGADLVFHFGRIPFIANDLKIGVRAAYNGGSDFYDALGRDNPFYFGLVLDTIM